MRMSEANEPIKIPNMMPKEIVAHLDKYIIGQDEAKKSIAIAIRNRYRRSACRRRCRRRSRRATSS